MKRKTFMPLVLLAMFGSSSIAQDGEQLFKTNCSVCHSIGKGKVVGPDLKGVNDRYKEDWLIKWTQSSQALVKSGDPIAVQVFNDNNKMVMNDFALSDEEVKSILGYIKEAEKAVAEPAKQVASGNQNVQTGSTSASAEASGSLLNMFSFTEYIILMIMLLMLIAIWVMGRVILSLTAQLREKK